jgi:hypothetical protein
MENSVNFIACADACNALMQVKPIQTLMHFAKNVKGLYCLRNWMWKHSDMNITKNVQMLAVNVQQNVKLCLK